MGHWQLFSEIFIRITSKLTDILLILGTPHEEQVQWGFLTLIFHLSTITAASGRVFSPSLGMW